MNAVYKAIAAVSGELARDGIGKDRRNSQQGYNFRGIDDVYNALAPLLAKHGLCILPRCQHREQVERTSAKGGALFYTTVDVEFDFIAAEDGSTHTVRVPGEAMDSADKSTNKAMSAAYKYAAMQAFCIPTEGDNDADATTHEVASRPRHEPEVRRDADPVISPEQFALIVSAAQLHGVEARAICEKAGVSSVKVLPAAMYADCMKWIERQAKPNKPVSPQSSELLDDSVPY